MMDNVVTANIISRRHRSMAKEWVMFLFCLSAYFVLLSIFATSSSWLLIDHIYTSFFLVTLLIPTAINDLWLTRRFLNQRRYALFVLLLAAVILIGTWFNQYFFDDLVDYILPNHYFISYYEYTDLLKFFVAFVVLAMLVNLSVEWFQLKEAQTRVITLEREKLNAELQALMNQINPHFLFNSLTVLYSLALKNAKDTSEAILRLSDILRYVIYHSREQRVTLSSEIELIENYIALQRYRVPPSARINFISGVDDDRLTIPPMLLLPLVENSFKHGVHGDVGEVYVSMSLEAKNGVVRFSIENNKTKPHLQDTNGYGIGLANIRERLALMFPGRSELRVDDSASTFRVDLMVVTD